MLIPVRCFSCNKPISTQYKKWKKMIKNGENPEIAINSLGLRRYCCKRMIISHVEVIDNILPYN